MLAQTRKDSCSYLVLSSGFLLISDHYIIDSYFHFWFAFALWIESLSFVLFNNSVYRCRAARIDI